MFHFIILVSCFISVKLLRMFLDVNFKEIKNIDINNSKKLEELTSKFPSDEQICRDMLKKMNNENVKIKIKPEYTNCLYTIFNDTITIGKFQQEYMKIQTIAHECIHSCQSKRMLWSNFIFTNIYLIYFIIISALTLFNKITDTQIYSFILLLLGMMQYVVRISLENEAMLKAKYIAKEYIEENNILNREEEKELLNEYERVNRIGVPFISLYTISMNIAKVFIYSIFALIQKAIF